MPGVGGGSQTLACRTHMHPNLRAFWRAVQIASPGQNATGSGTSEGDPEMTGQNNHGSTLLHRERRGQPEMVVSRPLQRRAYVVDSLGQFWVHSAVLGIEFNSYGAHMRPSRGLRGGDSLNTFYTCLFQLQDIRKRTEDIGNCGGTPCQSCSHDHH